MFTVYLLGLTSEITRKYICNSNTNLFFNDHQSCLNLIQSEKLNIRRKHIYTNYKFLKNSVVKIFVIFENSLPEDCWFISKAKTNSKITTAIWTLSYLRRGGECNSGGPFIRNDLCFMLCQNKNLTHVTFIKPAIKHFCSNLFFSEKKDIFSLNHKRFSAWKLTNLPIYTSQISLKRQTLNRANGFVLCRSWGTIYLLI